jgi:DNA-binding transcriptional LysR family regulator
VTEREPETSLPGLIAHEFDLAILEEYPGHPQHRRPELDYCPLATDPMRLAQPAATPPRSLAELGDHPWIMELSTSATCRVPRPAASTPPPGAAPASNPP